MNINKNNYEAFFLDYHEGNLSPHQVADLLLFIEQHPELKAEFEDFESITLQDIPGIKFDNKNELKKDISSTLPDSLLGRTVWDQILITSMEGLLTKEENALLDQQLSVDVKLQHDFLLYQKTKLIADTTIIYENKKALKRKDKKVVPMYYYIAVAASLLLLTGLFFIFNNNQKQELADEKFQVPDSRFQSSINQSSPIIENKSEKKNLVKPNVLSGLAMKMDKVRDQKSKVKNYNGNNEQALALDQVANSNPETTISNQPVLMGIHPGVQLITDNEQPITNNLSSIAQTEKENKATESKGFLSLRELAAAKIKEKTLDETTLMAERKSGRLKKINGWDVAQLAVKGFNKLTGRKVEIKPTYNEAGDVTAYSLAAGELEISKGR